MDIFKVYEMDAPIASVWAALVEPAVIEAWGGGPAVMAATPGTAFSLWGGDIHGTVVETVPRELLIEEWFEGAWDAPSCARFILEPLASEGTRLSLEHTGVPDAEAPDIDSGWDEYYLGPMKAMLEEVSR